MPLFQRKQTMAEQAVSGPGTRYLKGFEEYKTRSNATVQEIGFLISNAVDRALDFQSLRVRAERAGVFETSGDALGTSFQTLVDAHYVDWQGEIIEPYKSLHAVGATDDSEPLAFLQLAWLHLQVERLLADLASVYDNQTHALISMVSGDREQLQEYQKMAEEAKVRFRKVCEGISETVRRIHEKHSDIFSQLALTPNTLDLFQATDVVDQT